MIASARWSRITATIALLSISLLYFADVLLRASLKSFWFDELFTVYLCRLPSFHDTWTAVLHGCDFNPPLFYLLTRGCEWAFGEGVIATRLPAIVGVWIFGVCLYAFIARRLGRLCGAIAGLAPMFTLVHYYASEARSHGAVLGCCGLMLLCWQRAREGPENRLGGLHPWAVGLSLSWLAALLIHVYAVYLVVPFLLIEVGNFLGRKRVHLATCAAMLWPVAAVAHLYREMTRAYQSLLGGRSHVIQPVDTLQGHITAVYAPGLVLLLIFLCLLVSRADSEQASTQVTEPGRLSADERTLACGLLCLPLIGEFGTMATGGPFFDRYFLFGTAGYAILLAQAVCLCGEKLRVDRALVTIMVLLVAADVGMCAFFAWKHLDLRQVEPSSHFNFSASASTPLSHNEHLLQSRNLDVLVIAQPTYLFLYYYAPPIVRDRLVFGAPETRDLFSRSYRSLSGGAGVELRTSTYQDFFSTHSDFLVYASKDEKYNSCDECLQPFLAAGYTLRSVQQDEDELLEHFSR